MKKWIKEKLIVALGIDKLRKENEQLRDRLNYLDKENSKLKYQNEQIAQDNDTLMSQFNISADIYPRLGDSWAVISVHGKPEYVKFVDLSNKDMRYINDFLRQFERNNRTVDSPYRLF